VIYYEEYPYAEKPEEVTRACGGDTLQAQLIKLDEDALLSKVRAIACYRSQISTFFQDEAEMAARVRAYAEVVGKGQPAERLWHVPKGTCKPSSVPNQVGRRPSL
jgi:LmbE family N-acetylglucosaminyl deacetylase